MAGLTRRGGNFIIHLRYRSPTGKQTVPALQLPEKSNNAEVKEYIEYFRGHLITIPENMLITVRENTGRRCAQSL